MKAQDIETFLAVCSYESFTKAAEHCYTTQPNVSWRISALENELGYRLILRGRGIHHFALTKAGEIFLPQAKKWLLLWQETERMLAEGGVESYSFVCVPSLSDIIQPVILQKFREKVPKCALTQSSRPSAEICNEIVSGRMDAGVVCNVPQGQELSAQQVAREKMLFVCRRDAGYGSSLHLKQLDVSKLVNIHFSDEEKAWKEHYFSGAKKSLTTASAVQNPATLFVIPDAWAIVPDSYFYTRFPQKEYISCSLDVELPQRNIYLVSRIQPPQLYYRLVLETLQELFAEARYFQLT